MKPEAPQQVNINIEPTDKITLTGDVVFYLLSIAGQVPSSQGGEMLVKLKQQIKDSYKKEEPKKPTRQNNSGRKRL